MDCHGYRPASDGMLLGRTRPMPTVEPSCLVAVTALRFWTVIGLFSLATPVGIFVGFGMSGIASGHGGAALSALASGTFLYVAFMEVGGGRGDGGRARRREGIALARGLGRCGGLTGRVCGSGEATGCLELSGWRKRLIASAGRAVT